MRTKTALLIAVATAAGIATSVAQVFSVNAVGYVNKTIPANGFALISNPLNASNNTLAQLFQGVPNDTQVFFYTPGVGFSLAVFQELFEAWEPAALASREILPGEGVFVRNPTAQDLTITFVGEVPQGNLTRALPAGLQVVSSRVPQAGTATELGLVSAEGDQIFQWDAAAQTYRFSGYVELLGGWDPPLQPLQVGDAFFLSKAAAGSWPREFNVNQ
jgi:hypothetical protein